MNKVLLPALLLIFCSACKSKLIPTDSANNFKVNTKEFDQLKSKLKLEITEGGLDLKASGAMRIQKDSIIWLSVNGILGAETFRFLITKDSLFMMNRLDNFYEVHSYDSLSKKLNITINYQIIERILTGNLPIDQSNEDKTELSEHQLILKQKIDQRFSVENHINGVGNINKIIMKDNTSAGKFTIDYSEYTNFDSVDFPATQLFNLTYPKEKDLVSALIKITHKKVNFPKEPLSFPFKIPRKFRKKD